MSFSRSISSLRRERSRALGNLKLAPAGADITHGVGDVALQLLAGFGKLNALILHVNPRLHFRLLLAHIADGNVHLHADIVLPVARAAHRAVAIARLVGPPPHQRHIPQAVIARHRQINVGLFIDDQLRKVGGLQRLGLRQRRGGADVNAAGL